MPDPARPDMRAFAAVALAALLTGPPALAQTAPDRHGLEQERAALAAESQRLEERLEDGRTRLQALQRRLEEARRRNEHLDRAIEEVHPSGGAAPADGPERVQP